MGIDITGKCVCLTAETAPRPVKWASVRCTNSYEYGTRTKSLDANGSILLVGLSTQVGHTCCLLPRRNLLDDTCIGSKVRKEDNW